MRTEEVKREDAEALLAVYSPYVERTAVSFEYDVPTVGEFSDRIERITEKLPYLKATEDGEILGYAYASPFKQRRAYDWAVELSVYVRGDKRRHGVGGALYRELFRILSLMGVVNVNACITSPRTESDRYLNTDSIEFHKRMGFETVGKFHNIGYKFGNWYDMVWMEKTVGEHLEKQPEVRFGQWREYLK